MARLAGDDVRRRLGDQHRRGRVLDAARCEPQGAPRRRARAVRIVFALSRHFAPRPEDGHNFVGRIRFGCLLPLRSTTREPAHRGDPEISIWHQAHGASSDVWEALHHWHVCDVLHFPFRGRDQWENKGVGRARGDRRLGQYVSALLPSEAGRVDEQYDALVVSDDELARGVGDESVALDYRLLDAVGLGLEPRPGARLDQDVTQTALLSAMPTSYGCTATLMTSGGA